MRIKDGPPSPVEAPRTARSPNRQKKVSKMRKIPGLKLWINFEQEQIDYADKIAARFGITRAESFRRILDTGIDACKVFEGLGVLKLAEITKRTREACEKSVQPSLF